MIRRAYRGAVGLFALAFVLIVLAGILPIRPLLVRALVVAEAPRRADAIVVLGGGVHDDDSPAASTTTRLVHGLRLYHRGYAPVVILTGGNPVLPSVPESDVMARVARELGTKAEALIVERVADRTAAQGEAVARLARERGIRTVLLVTSAEHSYRASRVFRKTGLDVVSTPVVPRRLPSASFVFRPHEVVDRVRGLSPAVYECVAVALYWWRGWL